MGKAETPIQQAIVAYLKYKGWFVYKNHQSLGSYKGIADLTAIKNGRVVWIEVKTTKGSLSVHQRQFRDDILKQGGNFVLARSVEDIQKWERICELL